VIHASPLQAGRKIAAIPRPNMKLKIKLNFFDFKKSQIILLTLIRR
jgi:hypothetical protein